MLASMANAQAPFAPTATPATQSSSQVRGIYSPATGVGNNPSLQAPTTTILQPPTTNPQSPTTDATPLIGGQIVARFEGQVVLASDVLWQVNLLIEKNRDSIPPEEIENARKMLLRQQVMGLLDTKLLIADFRRTVPAENIPKVMENLEKPFEDIEIPRLLKMLEVADRRELAELLEKHGSSLADAKRQFAEKTIAGEWLRQRLPKPKPVTHEQMLEYYQEHLKEYDYPAQARWEELMVRFDRNGGDRAATWRAIAEMGNQLWQQVAKRPGIRGAVFAKMAKEKSHGFTAKESGLHDWTTRDSLRCQKLNDALFTLQIGQLSNIIESEQGFHIIRILERKVAGRTPFTEAQAAIRDKLVAQERKGLVSKELQKLRKDSRVWTVFDGHLGAEQLARPPGGPQRR